MDNNSVEVVSYNTAWLNLFEKESVLIKSILSDNCMVIHHIGSTAVEGLSAKPIIDILPVVKNISLVDYCNTYMEKHGYTAKGENGIPFRRFFQKGNEKRTHHVHVFEVGNPEIERHLKFRDWMRNHPEDRDAYGALKKELALNYPNNITKYILGKGPFIVNIDNKAGFSGMRMVRVLTERETQAAQQFRRAYLKVDMVTDLEMRNYNAENQAHIVLYKGAKIIGYTHIKINLESDASIPILVIGTGYRHKEIGSEFLQMCESWLSQKNIKKIWVETCYPFYQFYKINGYKKSIHLDCEKRPSNITMEKYLIF